LARCGVVALVVVVVVVVVVVLLLLSWKRDSVESAVGNHRDHVFVAFVAASHEPG
jgi:Na+/H+-dicarboxylate symporter